MKVFILFALLASTFAVEPVAVVPTVSVPHKHVPQHVQNVAEQHINHVLQHVPQVQNHIHQVQQQKEQVVEKNVVPNVHVPHVHGVPQHVQQFAKQHLKHVFQHIPHAQNHIQEHYKVNKPIPDVPHNPVHVVSHRVTMPQTTTTQVVNEKVAVPVQQFPNVPAHVQQVVQQVHQHVPEVVNAHVNQQQRVPKAVHIPTHVQNIVEYMHHHIPYVINQHAHHVHHHQQHHDNRIDDSSKCNFQCTRMDMSVCATNGKCWKQFGSLCQMSKWNCVNTERTFRQVDDAQCMDTSKPKCYPGDV